MFRRSSSVVKLVIVVIVSLCLDNWFLPPPLCLVSWLYPLLKYRKCIRHEDTNNYNISRNWKIDIYNLFSIGFCLDFITRTGTLF